MIGQKMAFDFVEYSSALQAFLDARDRGFRDEATELAISRSANGSVLYAELLNQRFERGEAKIATSPHWSWFYACVLNFRFTLGESAIASHPQYAFWYARDVIKGRFKLGEITIRCSLFDQQYRQLLDSLIEQPENWQKEGF